MGLCLFLCRWEQASRDSGQQQPPSGSPDRPWHRPTVVCPARRAHWAGALWCTWMIAWYTHRARAAAAESDLESQAPAAGRASAAVRRITPSQF